MVQAHIIFSGTVQGVGFRFTAGKLGRLRLGFKQHFPPWARDAQGGCWTGPSFGQVLSLICHFRVSGSDLI